MKSAAKRPARISQAQIARELGVSQPLVSQVLNGSGKYCAVETYVRVWKHALERGYRPKGMQLSAPPVSFPGIAAGAPAAKGLDAGPTQGLMLVGDRVFHCLLVPVAPAPPEAG